MNRLLIILPLSIFLYACPFESQVPLDDMPVEPVDSTLIGYWYGIVKDGSDFFGIEALDIQKKSDSLYFVTRYGKGMKGDMILPDTAYFTGFVSRIGNQAFMNLESSIEVVTTTKKKSRIVKNQRIYYISAFQLKNDTLVVKTVTDNFSPASRKGFTRPEQLRGELSSLIGSGKNIYDDVYSLSYRKIERPANPKAQ